MRTNAFRVDRMAAAFESLHRLDIDPACLAEFHDRAVEAVTAEEAYLRGRVAADGGTSECDGGFTRSPSAGAKSAAAADRAAWRVEAGSLTPRRLMPGPIDVAMALQAGQPALLPAYWQLNDDAGSALHDGDALLQYWADGHHTVAEIADRVEWETGKPMGEVALRYFKLLAEAALVRF